LALLLAFVARPVSLFAATVRTRFNRRERVLISWAGLRGGVPVVLATFPLIDHVPRSLDFSNLAFFAVLVSTLIQGATVELLAKRLGLNSAAAARGPALKVAEDAGPRLS
jgi:cell volume regulation protein A